MQLCFFEDDLLHRFHPLTLTRPIDDLRLGILTIAEKWAHALNAVSLHRVTRNEFKGIFDSPAIDPSEDCLWINSRYLSSPALLKEVRELGNGTCLRSGNTVIAARTDGQTSAGWQEMGSPRFDSLLVLETNGFNSINHVWDLYHMNGQEIINDIKLIQPPKIDNVPSSVLTDGDHPVYMEEGVRLEPGVVLSTKDGPIYLGKNATVMAGAVIQGPVAVCEGSIIKMGARIYGNTTAGPVCKIGGEVSNTVFHSYSNKAHEGYIGDSVVGQWCNFGAGTTVSNLKTNYSNVRIAEWNTQEEIDSGQQFLGIIMGDHSKTAINSVINSGTICGVNCNILSRDFPPKFIDSFSWVGSNVIQPYKLDKALVAMEKMMHRRDVTITEPYKMLMTSLFEAANRRVSS